MIFNYVQVLCSTYGVLESIAIQIQTFHHSFQIIQSWTKEAALTLHNLDQYWNSMPRLNKVEPIGFDPFVRRRVRVTTFQPFRGKSLHHKRRTYFFSFSWKPTNIFFCSATFASCDLCEKRFHERNEFGQDNTPWTVIVFNFFVKLCKTIYVYTIKFKLVLALHQSGKDQIYTTFFVKTFCILCSWTFFTAFSSISIYRFHVDLVKLSRNNLNLFWTFFNSWNVELIYMNLAIGFHRNLLNSFFKIFERRSLICLGM